MHGGPSVGWYRSHCRPAEGAITVVDSVAEAVRDVELVQESALERVELKQ